MVYNSSEPYEFNNLASLAIKRLKNKIYKYEIDNICNISNKSKFIKDASKELNKTNKTLVMVHLDIDKFKVINSRFGYKTGDKILYEIGKVLIGNLGDELYGKEDGDNFLILFRHNTEKGSVLEKINKVISDIENIKILDKFNTKVVVKAGIYFINKDIDIRSAIDKSKIAKKDIKNRYQSSFDVYNGNYDYLFEETKLEEEMLDALKK